MTELPLHDAYCDGAILSGKDCTLIFRRPNASTCRVALIDVDALQMDGFREGNIVSIFFTSNDEQTVSGDTLDLLYPPPHPKADAVYHDRHANFRRRKCSTIAAGELTIVEMQPSYGASLLAVCSEIRFTEG